MFLLIQHCENFPDLEQLYREFIVGLGEPDEPDEIEDVSTVRLVGRCKICSLRNSNHVFLDCGDVVVCENCVKEFDIHNYEEGMIVRRECPECKKKITQKPLRIFLK